MSPLPITVLVTGSYPPWATAPEVESAARRLASLGAPYEVFAPSPDDQEFLHLDANGALVHRLAAPRSYALTAARALPGVRRWVDVRPANGFALRVAERALELEVLWNRTVQSVLSADAVATSVVRRLPGLGAHVRPLRDADAATSVERVEGAPPLLSADLIICTYNRFDELITATESALAEVNRAEKEGIACGVTVVYQNEDLPQRLWTARPEWGRDPRLTLAFSSPPSLTRARNEGVRMTSREVAIFTDDDVELEPGFIRGHLDALRRVPSAIGAAGRILSPGHAARADLTAVGQIRASGITESNYESIRRDVTLICQTPMGANMSYRRAAMNALRGEQWFDERYDGSAYREESALAMHVFRHGSYFVFAPDAALFHHEAVAGGCENRVSVKSLQRRIHDQSLEYLFLNQLYARAAWLRLGAPFRFVLREVRDAPGWSRFGEAYRQVRAYWAGRQLYSSGRGSPP